MSFHTNHFQGPGFLSSTVQQSNALIPHSIPLGQRQVDQNQQDEASECIGQKERNEEPKHFEALPNNMTVVNPDNLVASVIPDGFPPELVYRSLAAYSLLRTLSWQLRLSPFTPNVFLRALHLPYPNKLLGLVHVSLLRILLPYLDVGYSYRPRGGRNVAKKRRTGDGDGGRQTSANLRAGDNLTYLDNLSWPLFYDDYVELTTDNLRSAMNETISIDFRNKALRLSLDLMEDISEEDGQPQYASTCNTDGILAKNGPTVNAHPSFVRGRGGGLLTRNRRQLTPPRTATASREKQDVDSDDGSVGADDDDESDFEIQEEVHEEDDDDEEFTMPSKSKRAKKRKPKRTALLALDKIKKMVAMPSPTKPLRSPLITSRQSSNSAVGSKPGSRVLEVDVARSSELIAVGAATCNATHLGAPEIRGFPQLSSNISYPTSSKEVQNPESLEPLTKKMKQLPTTQVSTAESIPLPCTTHQISNAPVVNPPVSALANSNQPPFQIGNTKIQNYPQPPEPPLGYDNRQQQTTHQQQQYQYLGVNHVPQKLQHQVTKYKQHQQNQLQHAKEERSQDQQEVPLQQPQHLFPPRTPPSTPPRTPPPTPPPTQQQQGQQQSQQPTSEYDHCSGYRGVGEGSYVHPSTNQSQYPHQQVALWQQQHYPPQQTENKQSKLQQLPHAPIQEYPVPIQPRYHQQSLQHQYQQQNQSLTQHQLLPNPAKAPNQVGQQPPPPPSSQGYPFPLKPGYHQQIMPNQNQQQNQPLPQHQLLPSNQALAHNQSQSLQDYPIPICPNHYQQTLQHPHRPEHKTFLHHDAPQNQAQQSFQEPPQKPPSFAPKPTAKKKKGPFQQMVHFSQRPLPNVPSSYLWDQSHRAQQQTMTIPRPTEKQERNDAVGYEVSTKVATSIDLFLSKMSQNQSTADQPEKTELENAAICTPPRVDDPLDSSSNIVTDDDDDDFESLPHFEASKLMRNGVSYHQLPAVHKLNILEFLLDELLSVDFIAAEMSRRRNIESCYGTPIGILPSESELEALENEDECAVCGLEGELLCCDGCPKSYHRKCINIAVSATLPEGKWLCCDCRIVDPAKFGPLHGGKKSSLDWFTLNDVTEAGRLKAIASGSGPVTNDLDDKVDPISCQQRSHSQSGANNVWANQSVTNICNTINNNHAYAVGLDKEPGNESTCIEAEFLIVHGFVFKREVERPSGAQKATSVHELRKVKQLKEMACFSPLSPEELSKTLDNLQPTFASKWPFIQIPKDVTKSVLAKSLQDSDRKEYFNRIESHNPSLYRNQYYMAPFLRLKKQCVGSHLTHLVNSDYEIECACSNTQKLSSVMSRDMSRDSQVVKDLQCGIHLYNPYSVFTIYMTKLERMLKGACLLHEMWGYRNKDCNQNLWSENVAKCRSIRRLAHLLVQLVDAANSRAFFEEWHKQPGYIAAKHDEDAETRIYMPLPHDWTPESELTKRKLERSSFSNIRSLLASTIDELGLQERRRRGRKRRKYSPKVQKADNADLKLDLLLEPASKNLNSCSPGKVVADMTPTKILCGSDNQTVLAVVMEQIVEGVVKRAEGGSDPNEITTALSAIIDEVVERDGGAAKTEDISATEISDSNGRTKGATINSVASDEAVETKSISNSSSGGSRATVEKANRPKAPRTKLKDRKVEINRPRKSRRSGRLKKQQVVHEKIGNIVSAATESEENGHGGSASENIATVGMESMIAAERKAKISQLEDLLRRPFEKTLNWPLAGRSLFEPIGSLSPQEMKRLARHGGSVVAPFLTYNTSFEVALPAVCQVWRKKTLECKSFEDLVLQIRVLESNLNTTVINTCESLVRRRGTVSKSQAQKMVSCTQQDLETGMKHYFVVNKGKSRGCWIPEESIDISSLVAERTSRRAVQTKKFNERLTAKSAERLKQKQKTKSVRKGQTSVKQPPVKCTSRRIPSKGDRVNPDIKARDTASNDSTPSSRQQKSIIDRIELMMKYILTEHQAETKKLLDAAASVNMQVVPAGLMKSLRDKNMQKLAQLNLELGKNGGKCADEGTLSRQLMNAEYTAHQSCTTTYANRNHQQQMPQISPQTGVNVFLSNHLVANSAVHNAFNQNLGNLGASFPPSYAQINGLSNQFQAQQLDLNRQTMMGLLQAAPMLNSSVMGLQGPPTAAPAFNHPLMTQQNMQLNSQGAQFAFQNQVNAGLPSHLQRSQQGFAHLPNIPAQPLGQQQTLYPSQNGGTRLEKQDPYTGFDFEPRTLEEMNGTT